MKRYNRLDDIWLPDPLAALRYALFRAEHLGGAWAKVYTIYRDTEVGIRRVPEDQESRTPEVIDLYVRCRTRDPSLRELQLIRETLMALGLDVAGERRDPDDRSVRMSLRRLGSAVPA
jgi:hypothetical protein